jgi:hypothetical protein
MRRLLVLAYFFPPMGGGGTQRTVKLVRYLEPAGWRSTVVTTRDPRYWILDPSLLEDVPPSTEVLRVSGWTPSAGIRLLGRLGIKLERPQGERRAGALDLLRRSVLTSSGRYAGWARRLATPPRRGSRRAASAI